MGQRVVTERLVFGPLLPGTGRGGVGGAPPGLPRGAGGAPPGTPAAPRPVARGGAGWPHSDTLDALGMVAEDGSEAWLVLEDGVVVGDAGTHGPPDEAGDVEIGYGLAEPSRGRGLSSEFVPALAQALLARSEVRRVVAREVLADNTPSRRALERAGFRLEREANGLTWYAVVRRDG